MVGKFLTLRSFLLLLLLLGFQAKAYAGAEQTPVDWIPAVTKVVLNAGEVVFEARATQIRLRDHQWENASSTPINILVEKTAMYIPRTAPCTVPEDVLQRYPNWSGSAEILSCDLPERIWFATAAYCGEGGDEDPLMNQGQLYSFNPTSGKVKEYRGWLPKCATVAGMAQIDNKFLMATVYQGEYGVGAGEILLFDLNDIKIHPKDITNPHQTGAVIAMSTYDSQCDCLWFATEQGIERLKLSEGKWEQRYLDYEITPDNQFVLTLSSKKPSDQKMWLGRMLYSYPIEDLRSFIAAWKKSPVTEYDAPRIGPLLLPFYFAAIERTKEGWTDWTFAGLMRIIAAYQDNESKVKIRAFIDKMLKEPMILSRRNAVVSIAEQFGVQNASDLKNLYFDDLLKSNFSGAEPNHSSVTDAVGIAFEHPEYLPRLRDYYLTHPFSFRVENDFIDKVKQHPSWKGYDLIAPAVEAGRKRYDHRLELLNSCARLESKPEGNLLPILQARLETDAQAKLSMENVYVVDRTYSNGNPMPSTLAQIESLTHTKANNFSSLMSSCIDASYYWINYGGTAQLRHRVEFMLELIERHKELSPVALDVLNYKFSTRSKSIEGWKSWWSHIATDSDCSKEMNACSGSRPFCASLLAPVNVATVCNNDCQSHVVGRLNAAGVSFSYNGVTPVAPPVGCVGFRKDIGGTEAGAKCIAKLLGYTYSPISCNEDAAPYTVKIK
ncbi:MAG: hypothetical protein ACOH1I_09860 [Gallionellaceae bacterium]|jgi:hypothetical protein